MAQVAAGLSFLEEEARKVDKDRFLCALFASHQERESLCALLVANQEIARIPESAQDPVLRRIRLQWWRDELVGGAGGTQHPVLARLIPAFRAAAVPDAAIECYLDARAGELDFEQPADLAALEQFAAATSGVIGETSVRLLDKAPPAALEAGRQVGTAWALVGFARSVPHHARLGRCYLPQDLCREHGVAVGDLLAGRRPVGLGRVVEAIVSRATALLRHVRTMRRQVPRAALPALLPAVLADGYVRTLRRTGYDPFAAALASPRPRDLLRLGVAGRLGRY